MELTEKQRRGIRDILIISISVLGTTIFISIIHSLNI